MSIIRDTTIKARKYLERDEILIFAGARQAGKTTILKQIKSELENRGKSCYFLNLEDPEYLELLQSLHLLFHSSLIYSLRLYFR